MGPTRTRDQTGVGECSCVEIAGKEMKVAKEKSFIYCDFAQFTFDCLLYKSTTTMF